MLDHMIVEGQVHGALAHGLGQALMEHVVYDATAASSSPARSWTTPCRAPTTCRRLRDAMHPVPATTNPLGVKGVGEAGTTAAIAAVMNADRRRDPGRRRRAARHAGDAEEGLGRRARRRMALGTAGKRDGPLALGSGYFFALATLGCHLCWLCARLYLCFGPARDSAWSLIFTGC